MKHHFFSRAGISAFLAICLMTNVYANVSTLPIVRWEQKTCISTDEITLADMEASSVYKVDTVEKKLYLEDGTIIKYSSRIWIKATAYCHCQKCCGKAPGTKGYGYTASGVNLLDGYEHKVVAAPKGWDFGTELYLAGVDGSADYGYATVEDRGGAIKGSRLDVYYPSHEDCLEYGVHKNVYAYIIEWVDYTHTISG